MTDKRFDINADGDAKVTAIGEVNAETAYFVEARSRRRPEKEIIWLKAFEKEVEGRLATSLHNQILINLGKQAQPEQVHRLWDMEVKSGQITETIPPETEILEVFDRAEIAGKLLILGKPGAGKTTTLLELARALVRRALDDPSEPMPFLLNLSSWKDPKQSIKDWSIAELTTKGIGSKLSKKWLEDQKFLPLFDGLDEVRSDLQPACVKAINEFLSGEAQPRLIAVCSRQEEYELYSEKLVLNGAIYLQELSDKQIERYLGDVDQSWLWQALMTDSDLLDLMRQPLWLSITACSYKEELAEQWQRLQFTQERIEFLLDAYVERMLHRAIESQMYAKNKEPSPRQTRKWLIFLAQQLQHESWTEFIIERIQPDWIPTHAKTKIYAFISILLFLFLVSVLWLFIRTQLFQVNSLSPVEGLFAAFIPVFLIIGLPFIEIFVSEASSVRHFYWSLSKEGSAFFTFSLLGLFIGLAIGLAGEFSTKLQGSIIGLTLGIILGILICILRFNEVSNKLIYLKNSIPFIVFCSIVTAFASSIAASQKLISISLVDGVLSGLIFGLLSDICLTYFSGWREGKVCLPDRSG